VIPPGDGLLEKNASLFEIVTRAWDENQLQETGITSQRPSHHNQPARKCKKWNNSRWWLWQHLIDRAEIAVHTFAIEACGAARNCVHSHGIPCGGNMRIGFSI
jgi:hypothetical protein